MAVNRFLFFARRRRGAEKGMFGNALRSGGMGGGQWLAHAYKPGARKSLSFNLFSASWRLSAIPPFFGGESGEFLIKGKYFYMSVSKFDFFCSLAGYDCACVQAESGAGFGQAFEFSLFGLRIAQVIADLYGLDDFSPICDQEVALAGIITIIKNVMASFFQL